MTTTTPESTGPLALVITADDGARTEHLPNAPAAMLHALNELVGGYLEGVAVHGGDWCAYVNEEGKLQRLPYNRHADGLARYLGYPFGPGDYLAGTAVFLGRRGPDEVDVPGHVLDLARAAGILT
jgi:hypothetical protein